MQDIIQKMIEKGMFFDIRQSDEIETNALYTVMVYFYANNRDRGKTKRLLDCMIRGGLFSEVTPNVGCVDEFIGRSPAIPNQAGYKPNTLEREVDGAVLARRLSKQEMQKMNVDKELLAILNMKEI